MCTLVILLRPGHDWPCLVAANRDERSDRAALPPGRHWEDRPEVLAGLDVAGGGSWLGLNDHGLLAAVLSRAASLGPQPGKRSRGELVLEALDHAEAEAAAAALADLDPDAYRPFNLLVADPRSAYWLRHDGSGEIRVSAIAPGLHMLCEGDLDDLTHPRIAAYWPKFSAAAVPDPPVDDWRAWRDLLMSRDDPEQRGRSAAMIQDAAEAVCTRSSALMALPAYPGFSGRPVWLHAELGPGGEIFRPVL